MEALSIDLDLEDFENSKTASSILFSFLLLLPSSLIVLISSKPPHQFLFLLPQSLVFSSKTKQPTSVFNSILQNFRLRILGGYAVFVNIGNQVLQRNLAIVSAF